MKTKYLLGISLAVIFAFFATVSVVSADTGGTPIPGTPTIPLPAWLAQAGFRSVYSSAGVPEVMAPAPSTQIVAVYHGYATAAPDMIGQVLAAVTSASGYGNLDTSQFLSLYNKPVTSTSPTNCTAIPGITLGCQGSSVSPEQSAAAQAANLAAANAATKAKSVYSTLTIQDFLLTGDSLDNWPAGTTATDLINWYVAHNQVMWQTPSGQLTPNLPSGMAAQGYIRTGTSLFTMPNGKQITAVSGQMMDPFGVGPTAIIPSKAADAYKQSYYANGGGSSPVPLTYDQISAMQNAGNNVTTNTTPTGAVNSTTASTIASLQAQISQLLTTVNGLMSQLQALKASMGITSGSPTGGSGVANSQQSFISALSQIGGLKTTTSSGGTSVTTPSFTNTCPSLSPVAPGWCAGGTIVAGALDSNGCATAPTCKISPTTAVAGSASRAYMQGLADKLQAGQLKDPTEASQLKTYLWDVVYAANRAGMTLTSDQANWLSQWSKSTTPAILAAYATNPMSASDLPANLSAFLAEINFPALDKIIAAYNPVSPLISTH